MAQAHLSQTTAEDEDAQHLLAWWIFPERLSASASRPPSFHLQLTSSLSQPDMKYWITHFSSELATWGVSKKCMKHQPGSWLLRWTPKDVTGEEAFGEETVPKGACPQGTGQLSYKHIISPHLKRAMRCALCPDDHQTPFPGQRRRGTLKPKRVEETFPPAIKDFHSKRLWWHCTGKPPFSSPLEGFFCTIFAMLIFSANVLNSSAWQGSVVLGDPWAYLISCMCKIPFPFWHHNTSCITLNTASYQNLYRGQEEGEDNGFALRAHLETQPYTADCLCNVWLFNNVNILTLERPSQSSIPPHYITIRSKRN